MKSLTKNFAAATLLTTAQTAELLNVTEGTLNTWRSQKKGPCHIRFDSGTIRYSLESILEYQFQRKIKRSGKKISTTRVLEHSFLYEMLNSKRLREVVSNVLNEYETKQSFNASPEVVEKLSTDNINNLNWAIDKLWLNIYLSDTELSSLLTNLDKKSKHRNGLVKVEGAAGYFSYHYSIKLRKRSKLSFVLLVEPKENGFNHIQLQLNPSHLNKNKDLKQFLKVIKILFKQCPVALLMHSQVRRYDICVDIPDTEVDLIIFRFKNARKSTIVRKYSNGKVVYRKEGVRKRQLVKIYQKGDAVRLEFEDYLELEDVSNSNNRSRPLLMNMHKRSGPFQRLELYSSSLYLQYGIHPHTRYAIENVGIINALKQLPRGKEHRNLKRAIENSKLEWNAKLAQTKHRKMFSNFIRRIRNCS